MPKPSLSAVAQHFGISRTAARDLEIQNVIDRSAGLDSLPDRAIFVIFANDIRNQVPPTPICARRERARSKSAPPNASASWSPSKNSTR